MKRSTPPELNRQILEEASDWFIDFRVGDVDEAASRRFDEWLRRSPEHIRAYWEIAKAYVELPPAGCREQLELDSILASAKSEATDNVVALNLPPRPIESRTADAVSAPARTSRAKRRRVQVAAAVVTVLVIAGLIGWQSQRYQIYTTDSGERRSITLADGSTVDLNARTRLRVQLSSTERRVDLLHGQALFQVARDRLRPFLVQSGDAVVRAVGTQFDVDRKDSGTTVTVLEGRVAVYSTIYSEPQPSDTATHLTSAEPEVPSRPLRSRRQAANVLVSAGQQVTLIPAAATPIPQRADINAATSWIQHKLIFEDSKLSDVAAEFNRYNARQIVINAPELSDFEISGVYSSTDPVSLLKFLRDQGLKVTEADKEVRIEAQ